MSTGATGRTTVINPPIVPVEHRYNHNSTYRIRVVVYDTNFGKMTYTYLEEPSLEVTVIVSVHRVFLP